MKKLLMVLVTLSAASGAFAASVEVTNKTGKDVDFVANVFDNAGPLFEGGKLQGGKRQEKKIAAGAKITIETQGNIGTMSWTEKETTVGQGGALLSRVSSFNAFDSSGSFAVIKEKGSIVLYPGGKYDFTSCPEEKNKQAKHAGTMDLAPSMESGK